MIFVMGGVNSSDYIHAIVPPPPPPPASTLLMNTGGGHAYHGLDSNQHNASIFLKC